MQDLIARGLCEVSGEVEIPSWLTPTPNSSDLPRLTEENNLRFIDEGGCDEVAESVKAFLEAGSANGIPAMVAVDHSTTGGALRALAKEHGSSDMAVLVVDSHFDGLQLADRIELFRYGNGTSFDDPEGPPADPCAAHWMEEGAVQESYNCATWLKHMLDDGVVRPDKLIVFGISDYPTAAMRQDPRLSRYVGAYRAFEEAGVTFVTKEEIRQKGVRGTLVPLLNAMAADRLYVSLDADIGSLDAVHAARFMNVVGLNSEELYEIARVLGRNASGEGTDRARCVWDRDVPVGPGIPQRHDRSDIGETERFRSNPARARGSVQAFSFLCRRGSGASAGLIYP